MEKEIRVLNEILKFFKFLPEKGYGHISEPREVYAEDYEHTVLEICLPLKLAHATNLPEKMEKDFYENEEHNQDDHAIYYTFGISKKSDYVFLDIEIRQDGETSFEMGHPEDCLDSTTYEKSDGVFDIQKAFERLAKF